MNIKCENCKWEGKEEDLIHVTDCYGSGKLESCPNCKDSWHLHDEEY